MLKLIESCLFKRELRKLIRACLGNKDKAQRLITFELNKNHKITKRQATKVAFDRLEKDRSR